MEISINHKANKMIWVSEILLNMIPKYGPLINIIYNFGNNVEISSIAFFERRHISSLLNFVVVL